MPIEYDKIFAWLPKVEGKMTARGYIPCYILDANGRRTGKTCNYRGEGYEPSRLDPMGVSGVTIGVGVDLGQQRHDQLRKWGCSDALMCKIGRYIGKADKAAVLALQDHPLTLSEEDVQALTRAEHRGYMDDVVVPQWNYRYGSKGNFESLPWQAQCVIFSLVYQLGWAGLRRRGEHTLDALTKHEWRRAVANLKSGARGWAGEYYERRAQEGELLSEVL